jgi:hypothetical protein
MNSTFLRLFVVRLTRLRVPLSRTFLAIGLAIFLQAISFGE